MSTTKSFANHEEALKVVMEEKANRETQCAEQYQKIITDLLKGFNCEMEIVVVASSMQGANFQIRFKALDLKG